MRNGVVVALSVVLSLAGLEARAQSHAVIGTWEMDPGRSTFEPAAGERDENSALSFNEGEDGFIVYTRSLITSQGNPGFAQSAFKFDDQSYPIYTIGSLGSLLATGTESTAVGRFRIVDANTVELTVVVSGQPSTLSRTFTVDSDGRYADLSSYRHR